MLLDLGKFNWIWLGNTKTCKMLQLLCSTFSMQNKQKYLSIYLSYIHKNIWFPTAIPQYVLLRALYRDAKATYHITRQASTNARASVRYSI